jgi:hypothetical protein
MKTNTRYILTATGVAAGLFLVGATANALATDNTATSAPIGSGVVLPSASAAPSASPSLVQVDYAENAAAIPAPIVDTAGWSTGPATGGVGGVGGDDGDDHEGDDD